MSFWKQLPPKPEIIDQGKVLSLPKHHTMKATTGKEGS
jgi:hypothetical protein